MEILRKIRNLNMSPKQFNNNMIRTFSLTVYYNMWSKNHKFKNKLSKIKKSIHCQIALR